MSEQDPDPVGIGVTLTGQLVLLHHRHNGHTDMNGRPICSACVINALRHEVETLRGASRPLSVHPGEVPS